eukprot:gene31668-41111_t
MNLFRLKPKRKDRNTEVASIESDIPVEDKKRNNRTARDSISEDGTKNSVGATNLHEHDDDNNNDTASGAERTENYEHDNDEESTHRVESISIEANITPGATEKNTLLSVLFELRKDGTFCDVAFLCHGTLFTAHRCVVSSWSRWLRALLSGTKKEQNPSPDSDEVVSMDLFDAPSFGAVLDYMYGRPLTLTVESAEPMIKIARRLEMEQLEQQCWKFLMTVLNDSVELLQYEEHVEYQYEGQEARSRPVACLYATKFHELADKYDCPPLKLASWRVLQDREPGYGSSPASKLLNSRQVLPSIPAMAGTGFVGPGDVTYQWGGNQRLSVFNYDPANYEPEDDRQDDQLSYDGSHNHSQSSASISRSQQQRKKEPTTRKVAFTKPQDLPPNAPAAEVIRAWAAQLKDVYDKCTAQNGSNFVDVEGFPLGQGQNNVQLLRKTAFAVDSNNNNSFSRFSPRRKGLGADANFNNDRGDEMSDIVGPSKTFHSQLKQQLTSGRSIDWKVELKRFYLSINMPNKVDNAAFDQILRLWGGKEDQMIASLVEKYKGAIPSHMMLHLDQLQSILETQSTRSNTASRARQL